MWLFLYVYSSILLWFTIVSNFFVDFRLWTAYSMSDHVCKTTYLVLVICFNMCFRYGLEWGPDYGFSLYTCLSVFQCMFLYVVSYGTPLSQSTLRLQVINLFIHFISSVYDNLWYEVRLHYLNSSLSLD